MSTATMKTTALAPWFGSNRMLAAEAGKTLKGCEWVGVPFSGGMAEIPHIKARTIVVNDLHRHIINLAMVIADRDCMFPRMAEVLTALAFHPDTLAKAQAKCKQAEHEQWNSSHGNLEWAINYFVACWMGRSAKAGTKDEFTGALPIRWSASGGDSNTRYRSAVESLEAWSQVMQRCNFSVLDFRVFLAKCKDAAKHGIYCDSPFPDAGEPYKHGFTEQDHSDLAIALQRFEQTLVVCRFYDHPMIRALYPQPRWHWKFLKGRKQSNDDAPEVLISNHPMTSEDTSNVS